MCVEFVGGIAMNDGYISLKALSDPSIQSLGKIVSVICDENSDDKVEPT